MRRVQPASFHNTYIKTVIIGQNVEFIGERAFAFCSELKEIDFIERTYSIHIEPLSFKNCKQLETVTLSNKIDNEFDIKKVFDGCPKTVNFKTTENNDRFNIINNIIYNSDKTSIIHYPTTTSERIHTVESSIKIIE